MSLTICSLETWVEYWFYWTTQAVKNFISYSPSEIGDLHDNIIWLQLPEFFTFSVSYANQGNCYLNPTGNSNFK